MPIINGYALYGTWLLLTVGKSSGKLISLTALSGIAMTRIVIVYYNYTTANIYIYI